MTLEQLRELIPDYAKDIRLNLGSLANETTLTDQQKWGAFLASAIAIGQPQVVKAFEQEAATRLTPQAIDAVRAAAAIMAMNNVYYRSLHLLSNHEYQTLRAGLRMNVLANPGERRSTLNCGAWQSQRSMAVACASIAMKLS
jgi:lipoyl-dependent peroxiredoxin subunit D